MRPRPSAPSGACRTTCGPPVGRCCRPKSPRARGGGRWSRFARCSTGSCTSCAPAASGKPSRGNSARARRSTRAFRSGPSRACGPACGRGSYTPTMRPTRLAGTGRPPTVRRYLPPLGGDATGPDPTNRGKLGTKRHVLADRRGAPLSVVLSAANRTDMKRAEATLDGMVIPRPRPRPDRPQHLCRDKGFDYPETDQAAQARGYVVHTARKRRRGEPHPPRTARHLARRWVIERTNSWHNRFRKLRIRYEKHASNYLGLVQLACALIVYRLCLFLG